jgi:hypothetical protein
MCDMCKPRVLTFEITVPEGAQIVERALDDLRDGRHRYVAALVNLLEDRRDEYWNYVREMGRISGWSRRQAMLATQNCIAVYECGREDRSHAKRGGRLRIPPHIKEFTDDLSKRKAPAWFIDLIREMYCAGWREVDCSDSKQKRDLKQQKAVLDALLDLATIDRGKITSDGHDGRKQRRYRAWKVVEFFLRR